MSSPGPGSDPMSGQGPPGLGSTGTSGPQSAFLTPSAGKETVTDKPLEEHNSRSTDFFFFFLNLLKKQSIRIEFMNVYIYITLIYIHTIICIYIYIYVCYIIWRRVSSVVEHSSAYPKVPGLISGSWMMMKHV